MADVVTPVVLPVQSEPEPTTEPLTESVKAVGAGGNVEAPAATEVPTEAPAPVENSEMKQTEEPAAEVSTAPAVNGASAPTPASNKKPTKRKSTSGTPAKKLSRKKSMPDLHLDVQPGEYWYVQMKGYPQWPAIICDEEMLPESLLSKRPVSAMRVDGTYRPDFEEGGKNARDRRYPVMFLGTNEFAWQVNTDLVPLDIDDIKGMVERNEVGKKAKQLWQAYQVAAEGNDLQYFKDMLDEHERLRVEEEQRFREAQEAKLAKKEKKSKGGVDEDGDVEMEDADQPSEKKKPSKKRKKSTADVEEDSGKKTKIVLKGLKASGDDEQPPKTKKSRKSKGSESEEPEVKTLAVAEPVLSEEGRHKRRVKTIMYLRHKLQKGLISRSGPPQAEDMDTMAEHLESLEQYQDLEPDIIRESKVNKLLKVILKLTSIPRDEEFKFKERCTKLLAAWAQILNEDEQKNARPANGLTNGKPAEPAVEEKAAEEKVEPVANGKAEEEVKIVEPEASGVAEEKMEITA